MIGEAVDEAVVHDRPLLVQDRGVVRLPHRQRGNVVRRHVVDEIHRPGTAHEELPHVAHVEQAGARAHRGMLGGDSRGILHGHLVAREGDHLGPERHVDVVERRATKVLCGGRL